MTAPEGEWGWEILQWAALWAVDQLIHSWYNKGGMAAPLQQGTDLSDDFLEIKYYRIDDKKVCG